MKPRKESLEALERTLFAERRGRGRITPGGQWRAAVMTDVRGRSLAMSGATQEAFVARFAWRLSAIAACAAIALLIYALNQGFVDYGDLAMRFLEDPVGFLM